MKEKIKVSVIVPIYNVEKYLNECVDSIINQTYKNLEIILVDDGSPDNSGKICDEYSKKDKRIKVIHKENGGLGYARNSGLEIATGDYVYFVDSDDYIDLNLIEVCVKEINKHHSDVILFGTKRVDSNGKVMSIRIPDDSINFYSNEEIEDIIVPNILGLGAKHEKNLHIGVSACANLISLKLIKRVNWKYVSEREIISEDAYSILSLYKHVKKVSLIGKPLYNYRLNDNSLTHTYREDRFEKNKIFYKKTLKLCNELNYSEKIKKALSSRYLDNIIGILKLIINSNLEKFEKYKKIGEIVYDEEFQEAISKIDLSKEKKNRKILLIAIKNKNVLLIYILLYINIKIKKR